MHKYPISTRLKTVLSLILLIGFSQPLPAATRYGDLLIQTTDAAIGESNFGYLDYSITISNSGASAHTVELIAPKSSNGYGNCIRKMTRKVTVPAGSAAKISLFQPPLPMSGTWAGVVIDGRYQQDPLPLSRSSSNHCRRNYGNNESCCVLVSRQVGYDDINKALDKSFGEQPPPGMHGMMPSGSNHLYRLALSERPVSDWSQNWLSYSRYNGILMTGDEWNGLPSGVRETLLEYVRCGGSLLVIGDAELLGNTFSFGQTTDGRFKIQYPGFGMVLETDSKSISKWTPSDWQVLRKSWTGTARNLRETKTVKGANDWFPVIDDLTIPVRGLLLIVLIFAILIGPANLFILARKKQQIWLLWTVPVFSLIASVIVFGYSIFAEGWRGQTRTQSLTILDESENLASTVGITAFYCPLNPRDGLHFDYETECTPQVQRRGYGRGNGRSIDWTEDQHFKSGWVTSRVPAHFKLRKSQMRREKIVFSNGSDALEALNGFGTPIETLYYADADGNVHHAENIEPGTKVTMHPVDGPVSFLAASPHFIRSVYEKDWHYAINDILKEPVRYLGRNCYIAVIKEPLFVEQALTRQKSEAFESIVYGISQGVADAG